MASNRPKQIFLEAYSGAPSPGLVFVRVGDADGDAAFDFRGSLGAARRQSSTRAGGRISCAGLSDDGSIVRVKLPFPDFRPLLLAHAVPLVGKMACGP